MKVNDNNPWTTSTGRPQKRSGTDFFHNHHHHRKMLKGLFKGKSTKSKARKPKDQKSCPASGLDSAVKALGAIIDSALIPGLRAVGGTAMQVVQATQVCGCRSIAVAIAN